MKNVLAKYHNSSFELREPRVFIADNGVYYANIYGDQMHPFYKPGDMVAIRKVDDFDYGHAHIIKTFPEQNDLKIVRYAIKHPTDDSRVILRSANPTVYPDLDWSKSYCEYIFKIVGLIRIEEN